MARWTRGAVRRRGTPALHLMRVRGSYSLGSHVPKSCPDCGSDVEYASASAVVLTGTCADCGRPLTIIEPGAPMPSNGTPVTVGADGSPAAAVPSPLTLPNGFRCAECGESLAVESATSRQLEVRCTDCDTMFTYVLRREGESNGGEKEDDRRPTWRPERSPSPGPSRARPCRECGAPLRFSTNDEGLVTGECTSCGNRFTLPPRRDGGGRPGPRREGGGFSDRPRYDRGPPRGGRSFGGGRGPPRFGAGRPSFRPRNRWNDDQREGPPRRRKRSDDE